MAQGVLPYKIEDEKTASGMTSLAGLPIYLDLASVLNPGTSITQRLHIKRTDEQIVMALILLNLAGGDSVDDLKILESDEGFCRILRRIELKGLKKKSDGRWREGGEKRSDAQYPPHPSFSDISPLSMRTFYGKKARQ